MKDTIIQTPIGNIEIKIRKGRLTGLSWTDKKKTGLTAESREIKKQLLEYLRGERKKNKFPNHCRRNAIRKKSLGSNVID